VIIPRVPERDMSLAVNVPVLIASLNTTLKVALFIVVGSA